MNKKEDHAILFPQPQSSRDMAHPQGNCTCQCQCRVTQSVSPTSQMKGLVRNRPLICSSKRSNEIKQGSNPEPKKRAEELVSNISLPKLQKGVEKSNETKRPSQAGVPSVHYAKSESYVSVHLGSSIVRLVPQRNVSKTETVLQICQDDFPNNSSSKGQDRTAVRCPNSPKLISAKDTDIVQSRKEVETCRVQLMSSQDNPPPVNVASDSVPNNTTEDISTDKPRKNEIERLEYTRRQWTFILISWFITAFGLGAYIYMLAAAYSGYPQIFEEKPAFPLIVAISNICLVSAIYCNFKLYKYFLL